MEGASVKGLLQVRNIEALGEDNAYESEEN